MDRAAPIPVVFMTAKVLPSELAQFLHLGALGVIRKPFNPLTLCSDLLAIWNPTHTDGTLGAVPGNPREALLKASSLTAAFLQRLARDMVVLQRWIALGHPTDQSRLPEMERLVHSINGAGAMFGFPGLSSAAAEVERLLSDASAPCNGHPPLHEFPFFARLSERVAELAERAAEAGCA
jgi:CheY-like chemotaxis protein